MQKTTLYLLLLFTAQNVKGQINWAAYSQSYQRDALDDPKKVSLIVAIPKSNNSFWTSDANSDHYFRLAQDSTFQRLRPAGLLARTTFDSSRVHFFLHGHLEL